MNRNASRRVLSIGLSVGLGVAGLAGCSTVSSVEKPDDSTKVVARYHNTYDQTSVRAYSLRGVGLKDALPEEIQSFMDTMRTMVVAKSWDRTGSAVQIFGVLMTVRTTPENHLMIEQYLNDVRQVLQSPLSMGPSLQ